MPPQSCMKRANRATVRRTRAAHRAGSSLHAFAAAAESPDNGFSDD
jgi:hypothetical protein